jgi:hypothetical protein
MKDFGGPKISQWEGVIQKGSIEYKEKLRTCRSNSGSSEWPQHIKKGKKFKVLKTQ